MSCDFWMNVMKVLVCAKRVIDYNVQVQVRSDHKGVVTDGVKMSMNPFCEIALEEAIKLKKNNKIEEVITVNVGHEGGEEVLKHAFAMGSDRTIWIKTKTEVHEPRQIAYAVSELAEKEKVDLILMGKQGIDQDYNQTGQMLAAKLGWPQATFASKIEFKGKALEVQREVDDGLETIKVALPAVVTTDLRLNVPHLPTLPEIIKAKAKQVETLQWQDMQAEQSKPQWKLLKVEAPKERKGGKVFKDIEAFFDQLKEDGVI